jgi:regulatory protein
VRSGITSAPASKSTGMRHKHPDISKDPRERALRLLALRDHSCAEIRKKLAQRGFATEEISAVIDDLAAKGLLDDARFAARFGGALAREKHLGPRSIQIKLFQRGISAEIIQQVTSDLEDEVSPALRLRRTVGKKLKGRSVAEISVKERASLAAYLRGRGFSWEDISSVLVHA